MNGFFPLLWDYLTTVLSGWTGIALAIIALVGLFERAIDRRFTISTRSKIILAVVILFIAQFLAYKAKHDDLALLTARTGTISAVRAGLLPLIDEGQKMWPDCLGNPQAKIDEWAGRVESHLRSKGDEVRLRRFRDESGIPPNLPDAAIYGYEGEQAYKCIRFNARLYRLNEFLRDPN